MRFLLVDDEYIILKGMEMDLRSVVAPEDEIITTQSSKEALRILEEISVDVLFSDVDMPGINGIELAKKVEEISPDTAIVFATGYAQYSFEAWDTEAVAFIVKPVGKDEFVKVIDKIKRRMNKGVVSKEAIEKKAEEQPQKKEKEIEVMCFGNFEILYDEHPIHFARKKSKEMLAYLIDRRGAMVTTDEIRAILWEEDDDNEGKKGYVRVLANDIRKSFDVIGVENILHNDQNRYSVDVSRISCDYLDMLKGKPKAKNKFFQEYMSQYSWAESTLARLLAMK